MAINIGDKEIKKIAVGDKIIMENKESNWVELELPSQATPESGNLLFEDMGNGTARIFGGFSFMGNNQSSYMLCSLPKNYHFVSCDHYATYKTNGKQSHGSQAVLFSKEDAIYIKEKGSQDDTLYTKEKITVLCSQWTEYISTSTVDYSPFILIHYTKD